MKWKFIVFNTILFVIPKRRIQVPELSPLKNTTKGPPSPPKLSPTGRCNAAGRPSWPQQSSI